MDQVNRRSSAALLFEELLADAEGRKLFTDAVHAAFLEMHGGSDRAYHVDRIGRLAAAIESHGYATRKMLGVTRFPNRNSLLKFAAEQISVDGPILEFGVFSGRTINFLATLLPEARLYGFDSFQGLPEQWLGKRADGGRHFDRNGEPPAVRENVELVIGWFDHMLPHFLDTHDFEKASLIHVDCDLYSSTQTILSCLHHKIARGTIIVFDEYFNYPTWERHEFSAFQEYVKHRQIRYEYIGLVPSDLQAAVRIL